MAVQNPSTKRALILQVAANMFCTRGYEATTMRDIAAEMGMEAASLYHHIRSKDEILEAICFKMAQQFITAIEEVNDIYFNAEEKLRMAIRQHVQILTSSPDEAKVFLHEWRSLPLDKRTQFIDYRNQYEQGLRQIILDGMNEDVFENVDPKFAGFTILSTINGVIDWYKPDGEMTPEQIANKLGDFIMGGLRKKLVTDLNYKP